MCMFFLWKFAKDVHIESCSFYHRCIRKMSRSGLILHFWADFELIFWADFAILWSLKWTVWRKVLFLPFLWRPALVWIENLEQILDYVVWGLLIVSVMMIPITVCCVTRRYQSGPGPEMHVGPRQPIHNISALRQKIRSSLMASV